MRKLLLLSLTILLFSCGDSELTRGETIDKMNREVNSFLPQDFNNGIVWTKAINEDNLKCVPNVLFLIFIFEFTKQNNKQ